MKELNPNIKNLNGTVNQLVESKNLEDDNV